ncbi:MAG TPA: hypothetical protein VFZ22_23500 [Pyrinomonadaceae bacterium]|nr:hypothetical protein [Pyrinomonadaceae bacterium]
MILLVVLFYLFGAVWFWFAHKSESSKLDFLLGLAWPIVVPINWLLVALEERRERRVQAQTMHEAELRAREERFIGYAERGTTKWMTDEVTEGQDKTEAEEK